MSDAGGQPEREQTQRRRVAFCSIVAGVVLFGGQVYNLTLTLKAPRVGLIQGMRTALSGLPFGTPACPATRSVCQDPRSQGILFTDHHAAGVILAAVALAVALALTIPVLAYLYEAVRFRRPETSPVLGAVARVAP